MNNNINNISFKSKFEVAAGIKNKFAYRYSIPKKLENSLKDKFEKVTKEDDFILELAESYPGSKYSKFLLKQADEILASSHEEFLNDSKNMTVEKLVKVYNKLLLKKNYNAEIQRINEDYLSKKRAFTQRNDRGKLVDLERGYLQKINELNATYNKLFQVKLYG